MTKKPHIFLFPSLCLPSSLLPHIIFQCVARFLHEEFHLQKEKKTRGKLYTVSSTVSSKVVTFDTEMIK